MGTFTIEVEGDTDLLDCQYVCDEFAGAAIVIDRAQHCITRERCHAILRKLAELSEEESNLLQDNIQSLVTMGSYVASCGCRIIEAEIEEVLWNLLKAKYQKKKLTDKEKLEKIKVMLKKEREDCIVPVAIQKVLEILEAK